VKKISNLPFLITFLVSMSLGFQAGSNFIIPGRVDKLANSPQPARKLSILPSGQRSILLVVVDSFQAEEPTLESAWLFLYLPENPRVTLMPVFPTLSRDIGSDEKIRDSFAVDSHSKTLMLNEDFLISLKMMEFWWSGYILMDKIALEQISRSLSAPLDKEQWKRNGSNDQDEEDSLTQQAPLTWISGNTSAAEQASFYLELCKKASGKNSPNPVSGDFEINKFNLESLIPDHLYIDFFMEQLQKEIQSLRKHGENLSCEFPLFYSEAEKINSAEVIDY
jgi:hypothetical protein